MEEENVGMSKAYKQGSFSWRPEVQREAGIPQTLHYTSAHVSKHSFVVTGRVLLCLVDARHAAAHPQFPKGPKSSVSSAEFKKP